MYDFLPLYYTSTWIKLQNFILIMWLDHHWQKTSIQVKMLEQNVLINKNSGLVRTSYEYYLGILK